MLRSILYFSNSTPNYLSKASLVELVHQSQNWNDSVGITGALVTTERNFVQFIEGPTAAIGDLFDKIRTDRRHTRINVIQDAAAQERYFPEWSLAYWGPDAYIDNQLAPILQRHNGSECAELAVSLRTLLRAMANGR